MAEFSVRIVRIAEPVVDHPNADRLSLVKIGGYTCISAKNELGLHRYAEGGYVVYVPEGAVLPEALLRHYGFWNEEQGKGLLAGSKGDRVKAKKLRDIFSQGILLPVTDPDLWECDGFIEDATGKRHFIQLGDDVAGILGITKYEPPIPASMAGEVVHVPGAAIGYDFESIQRVTDLFSMGEEVEATEKLHGTNFQFGYVPGLNHPELFFDGNVYCCSKGLGAKDLVMKNNEANAGNVYVRALRAMLDAGLGESLRRYSQCNFDAPVRVFAEIYGHGVQDLTYGRRDQGVAVFDIALDRRFISPDARRTVLRYELKIPEVPVLYHGPYDLEALAVYRDGRDTISGSNVREGIVIRATGEQDHPIHGRKIGKWVSPDYLLRKGNTTELS